MHGESWHILGKFGQRSERIGIGGTEGHDTMVPRCREEPDPVAL